MKPKTDGSSLKASKKEAKADKNDLNDATSSSSDDESLVDEKRMKYNVIIVIPQPSDIRRYFIQKKYEIEVKSGDTVTIEVRANKTDNSELEFHVYSNNETSFERAVSTIKSWKSLKFEINKA